MTFSSYDTRVRSLPHPAVPDSIGGISRDIIHMDLGVWHAIRDGSSSASIGGRYCAGRKINKMGDASISREKQSKFTVIHDKMRQRVRELKGYGRPF